MPVRSPLLPLAAALLSCFAPALWAQSATGDGAAGEGDKAALARVVVTGSNIRRSDGETPSPVQKLTADDIARSGYSTLGEVLQHLSANNMGSLGQATPGAFGAGGSGISLRGMTVGATLVLIDGHRMAPYPLPDDGQRDFVDIASIPVDAVERVEVLKDGASAIYGSDAMAGVVNVILKRSQQGGALHAEVGSASRGDGRSVKLSGARGFGDLDRDGMAGYVAASARRQQPILLSDRPALGGSDWTRYGGQNLGLTANPELQVSPQTRNYSLLGKLTALLPQDWTLSLAGSVLGSSATQVGLLNGVSPKGGITTFAFGPDHPLPTPTALNGSNVIDPVSGNPVDQTFADLPAQRSRTATRSTRFVAELSGGWAGWDVQAALGLTRVATELTMRNFISLPALQAALNSGKYVIGANNPADVLASLTPEGRSTSSNTLNFVSLRASRDLMKLAGGNLALGTGLEFTKRSLDERFPDGFASGLQASNIYAFGVGKQTISAAYVELAAPLTRQLEVDAAARVDHYDTYGSSTTPKLGFKFLPLRELTLRGTYAGGFRAPNPVEIGISGSSAGYLPPLLDTALCAVVKPGQPCDIYVGGTQLQLPGKDLRPEKSKSYTLGLVFEPGPAFNLSLDYYDVKISNQIVSVGLFGQYQIDTPDAYGTRLYRVHSPTTANAAPTGPDDTILYGTYPFINLGSARSSGLDLDLRLKLDGGAWGRFTPQLQWTHMIRYTIDRGPGQVYELAGTHGPSFVSTNTGTPRERGALALTWARGPVELTGTLNYTSGMRVEDASYNLPDCASALSTIFPNGLPAGGSPLCRVPSFTTVNLSGSWQVSERFSLRASVANLFDRAAPIDAFASGSTGGGVSSGGAHYNPSLHQEGAVGRYLTLGLSYRF
ncbi:TonB-dependent receptor [Pelomonas aquatica]|jgi:iron complex outermembrane receptor protein|nr:TonB-dependent receptor [Pelomonas aquatica]MCY4753315.1 TonB-dependent receptor [Pelomonas aquatica]